MRTQVENEHKRFLKWVPDAEQAALHSKDPNTKVGCLVIDERGCVRATGYNGFPRGVRDNKERYEDRETKIRLVAHAELNTIANAAAVGTPLAGCTLLVTKFPCHECAKAIINTGIVCVIAPIPDESGSWYDSNRVAASMFHEAGVDVVFYTPDALASGAFTLHHVTL